MPEKTPTNNHVEDKIDNTELVETFRSEGGKLFHARPFGTGRRGITFAYKVKGSRIEFATAVQHRNDTFTKKVGTKTAIEHFHEGKTVVLPLGRKALPTECFDFLARFVGR